MHSVDISRSITVTVCTYGQKLMDIYKKKKIREFCQCTNVCTDITKQKDYEASVHNLYGAIKA